MRLLRNLPAFLAAITTLALLFSAPEAHACLAGGDERTINAALQGPGTKAELCPRAIFLLHAPIVLSADGQEIATAGYPTDETRAIVRVVGRSLATAITSRVSNIAIRNIEVDGSRPALGPIPGGRALIEIGGAVSNIRVDSISSHDPRGWSALHVFEGGGKCRGAFVTNNRIGPAGTPDGHWADGISFACRNGLIAGNVITDASDGGIVIFGAPGTVVENNLVRTRRNILLGGINLVDYQPFFGDYTGTIVRHNRIEADGGFIKVGIAIGPATWQPDKGLVNSGGQVIDNLITGSGIGYGIVVSGVNNFVVMNNRVAAKLGGAVGPGCPRNQIAPGQALVVNPGNSQGRFQADFLQAPIQYAICIQPR
ncbi:MAG: right-handed parallel beta-helix repeat-containing protein [Acidobacteriia bacterium]|nr:right-handed parallel beta-helix repeat-containing protein [Methyloceanibacter sp.]MCL6490828.1 right-handed parallel beta-helix repeat-containing protein [Terriglobia bacterium]